MNSDSEHVISVESDQEQDDDKKHMEICMTAEQQELDKQTGEDSKVYPLNPHSSAGGMHAVLSTRDLWEQFHDLNTEMIVTRRGRRMFPPIKVEVQDLKPSSFYVLLMDLVPVDKYRYKYQNSQWVKCFEESCSPTRLYVHPESPALGSYWMEHCVSFYKLKLTNNQLDKQGHIIVNSMHRYQPRLHIVESSDVQNLNWEDFSTFEFPKTQFITVTAYQNDKITQLKIESNPFAKGFRSPMSRIRMKPVKTLIRSTSDTGSDEHGPILLRRDGVIYTSTLKRQSSTSEDELPANKRPLFFNPDSESTGVLQVTAHKNPAAKGICSSNNATSTYESLSPVTHSRPAVISMRCNSGNISPSGLVTAKNNMIQMVPVNQSPINTADVSFFQSQSMCIKSSGNSSSEESGDDSDAVESPMCLVNGAKISAVHSNGIVAKPKHSLLPTSHFMQVSHQQPVTVSSRIMPSSAVQQMISYQHQPIFIQPSLDGRAQHILVPIATVPVASSNTNKIPNGGPQSLYLQTCPIVQGTNSSQTLQVATLPNCNTTNQTQQLLSNSLPIFINGQSTQLASQSPQPLQIVTLSSPPRVHS